MVVIRRKPNPPPDPVPKVSTGKSAKVSNEIKLLKHPSNQGYYCMTKLKNGKMTAMSFDDVMRQYHLKALEPDCINVKCPSNLGTGKDARDIYEKFLNDTFVDVLGPWKFQTCTPLRRKLNGTPIPPLLIFRNQTLDKSSIKKMRHVRPDGFVIKAEVDKWRCT